MIHGDLDQMYISNNAVRLMKFLNGNKALTLTYAATLCFKKRSQCDHDVWCFANLLVCFNVGVAQYASRCNFSFVSEFLFL